MRKILNGDAAKLAARLGLINLKDWERRFGGTCLFYEIQPYSDYAEPSELSLSPAQAERFQQLQRERDNPMYAEVRAKALQREEMLDAGAATNSPEVVALGLAINQLQARTHEPLPRDIVMSIINTSQKAKFAEFELQLDWVSDAIELRLIERSGEVLCH